VVLLLIYNGGDTIKARVTFEEIKEILLKESGYIVVSDKSVYKNQDSSLEYICPNHSDIIQRTRYSNYRRGARCFHCNSDSKRFSFEYVYNYFLQHGCELLSTEYTSVDIKLKYKCVCDNVDEITFYNFKNKGRRCRLCSIKKANHAGIKHYYVDVKKHIEDTGYTLITEEKDYINAITHILVSCDKGHEYKVTFKNFKKERRCPICQLSKGETKIEAILRDRCIKNRNQYEFNDLLSDKDARLKFDFGIFINKELHILIEYDGEFHFQKLYEDDDHERTVKHDHIKNSYCIQNNIPLFRIPYWEYDNLEYILDHILGYYKLINKTDTEPFQVHKYYLVNHPDWTYEKYIEQSKINT
jgi:hypothetical protein